MLDSEDDAAWVAVGPGWLGPEGGPYALHFPRGAGCDHSAQDADRTLEVADEAFEVAARQR